VKMRNEGEGGNGENEREKDKKVNKDERRRCNQCPIKTIHVVTIVKID
jgi:hypothetical protein